MLFFLLSVLFKKEMIKDSWILEHKSVYKGLSLKIVIIMKIYLYTRTQFRWRFSKKKIFFLVVVAVWKMVDFFWIHHSFIWYLFRKKLCLKCNHHLYRFFNILKLFSNNNKKKQFKIVDQPTMLANLTQLSLFLLFFYSKNEFGHYDFDFPTWLIDSVYSSIWRPV